MFKKKAALSIITAMTFTAGSVFAQVLGNPAGSWVTDMGANTYLHGDAFESDSVGRQSDYYFEYTPNEEAVPVVINGESLWGTRTITQAMSYMTNNGLRPLIGINADYFSFKTGIPMGTSVMNGEIATSANGYIDAVGFRSDGTGFIRGLNLNTTVYHGEKSANVECINKWYTKDYTPIAILTDKFGATTKTSSECLFLVCSPAEGSLSIGKTLTLTVDDKFEYNGDVSIPQGKIILLINKTGYENDYNFLNEIGVGESISVTNTALDDSEGIWETAYNAIGTSAGRLLKDGEIGSGFESGTAPRTAVGIKADGNIIFYVLDGRQTGHSYGAQAATLAKRLKELGCVDALNFDGGGSSVMAGIMPGSSDWKIINMPSDGSPRACANYLFLRDNRQYTGIPRYIKTDNVANKNFVSGTSTRMNIVSVYDTGNYKLDGLQNAEIRLENDGGSSYIDSDNVIHFEGTGTVYVNVVTENGIIYSEQYASYETPDDIKLYDSGTWKEITELYCPDGEYSVDLAAAPSVNGIELNTQDNAYEWSVVGDIGTIDRNGVFTLSQNGGKAGKIVVKIGNLKKEFNVFRSDYSNETETGFADINGHWAQSTIVIMAEEGILNGYKENGRMYFKPDNYMNRAEFAKMICAFSGIDSADYADTQLVFGDSGDIPLWARDYVKAMYEMGIIKGRANDDGTYTFAPFENISRAEAMTILGRIIEDNEMAQLNFADNADIPDWAAESMQKLLGAGIINGYSDNTIKPQNNIKRAEAAVMLYKLEH